MKQIQRLAAYDPNGGRLGPIPMPTTYAFSVPLNEVSAATVNYLDQTVGASVFGAFIEVAAEYSNDNGDTWTEYPNGRYLRTNRSAVLIGDAAPKAFTLPGYGWLLNKMRQMKITGLNADGKRPFNSVNAGTIMKTLIDESKGRGVCTGMLYDFSTTVDSSGAGWAKNVSIAYEPGLDLFTILNNLSLQGLVDWYFQGRTLRMFNADTTMAVARNVKMVSEVDLKGMPVQASIDDLIHTALVMGDGTSKVTVNDTSGAPTPWGKFEGFISQGGVSATATLNVFGQALIDDNAHEKVQYTAEVAIGTTRYEPITNYGPGDYIVTPSESGAQSFRVRQLNFARDEKGERSLSLIINDRFVEREIRNARRTNGITGGASAGGTGTVPTKDPAYRLPKKPVGLIVGSNVLFDPTSGLPYSVASMSYPAVTVDVNDIALSITRYRFQARTPGIDPGRPWSYWGEANGLVYDYGPLPQGSTWLVQMAAISEAGVVGPWSDDVSVTLNADVEGPLRPSAPVLTSRLGTVTVKWDGKANGGVSMPKDFAYVRLYRVGTATPIATLDSALLPVVVSDVTIGSSVSFYFDAVDVSGNVSGSNSDTSTITVASIMSDAEAAADINANVTVPGSTANKNTYSASAASGSGTNVGDRWFQLTSGVTVAQWRWDGSAWQTETVGSAVIANLDAGKITTGTLLAARIASGDITADKIAGGAIDATKLTATAIDGKVITGATVRTAASGARVQLTSSGLQAYNSSGTNTVTISAANGSFTAIGGTITGALLRTSALTTEARVELTSAGRFRGWGKSDGIVSLIWDFFPYNDNSPGLLGEAHFYLPLYAHVGVQTDFVQTGSATLPLTMYGAQGDLIVGQDNTKLGSMSVYNVTTSSAANVRVGSDGAIVRSTSATKYKTKIEASNIDSSVLELSPVTWLDKAEVAAWERHLDSTGGSGIGPAREGGVQEPKRYPGFLAEEVEKVLGPGFIEYGREGQIEGILYDRLAVPLYPIVRDLLARVQTLEESWTRK